MIDCLLSVCPMTCWFICFIFQPYALFTFPWIYEFDIHLSSLIYKHCGLLGVVLWYFFSDYFFKRGILEKYSPERTWCFFIIHLLFETISTDHLFTECSGFCRVGQETLMEENLADDEIEIELAPISVQLGYVQQVIKYFQYILLLFIVNLCLFYCITVIRSLETHKKPWSPILISSRKIWMMNYHLLWL